ncbi:two-component system, OmpR family, KDP operon response regulator KdpE [Quadrisphaera granulorum]|uniref:Two-component system KDP operon response regulator KdpE n=1 Tax=Quadrisphaera granulorum TaxID=317664 RepID=A0A316A2A2_9ACTN|nr:response regulator [Quadrisphaera granulorum]PWJ51775.1 two-component system KDP operon response regulator KdpE [Quadrisphaera granulorum]SZE97722.1 two-component system, OmpR family, KDP operon response regulator KdpE [Quadrisphaera granulorum]
MTRVLVVEDEPALARALAITLRAKRYDVDVAHTGAAALDAAATRRPDVVVLDLGLPDLDGLDVLRALRGWSAVPVVVLSARHDSSEKVEALDAGADDYVTKPFAVDELLARLRAAVRRGEATGPVPDPVVETARFTVDLPRRRVLLRSAGASDQDDDGEGEPVRLTPTEWQLLAELARSVGRVVGRRELLVALRGPHLGSEAAETHYLRVYVAQLRRKLEADPSAPKHLITEPGVGYRLVP